ncbi:MAG: ribonuclease J, partial [Pseudomonadota bacterium]|nr:ribonuclease J [Pseudomonadota bacterium]
INVTHSIPESHMLALTTAHGTVLHTGDWKLDPDPIVGDVTNDRRLKELGQMGLMALIGDSTNALVPGRSGSEREVQNEFNMLFSTVPQRIIITCFASNVARLKSIAAAAKKNGRYVTLAGRSLWRNAAIAEACGYLPEYNDFLSENEAMNSPRDKVVVICTGCQGEPRSALWRIAVEDHPEIEVDPGDTVIFSSRDIPGNEKAIARLQNRLISRGLKLLTEQEAHVHVSGHPAQDELTELYQWTRPHLSVPVHGEARHQVEHARIATECQVPHTLIPTNGQIIRLGPGLHEVAATVPSGRMGLDGKTLRRMDTDTSKSRKKMSYNGAVVITLLMDTKGRVLQDPQVSVMGIGDEAQMGALHEDIAAVVHDGIENMPKSARLDDAAVRHTVAQVARKRLQETEGKKPVMDVHLVRV